MLKKKQTTNNGEEPEASPVVFVFRLYITGATPNSIRAVTNIRQICEEHIKGNYTLEIIDVYQQQAIAEHEQLIALPLLVRKEPLPERRLIGDLSNTAKVLKGLGITQ